MFCLHTGHKESSERLKKLEETSQRCQKHMENQKTKKMTTDRKFPETRPETHSVINLDMVFNLSKVCWYYTLGSHCVIIGSTPKYPNPKYPSPKYLTSQDTQ